MLYPDGSGREEKLQVPQKASTIRGMNIVTPSPTPQPPINTNLSGSWIDWAVPATIIPILVVSAVIIYIIARRLSESLSPGGSSLRET